MKDLIQTPVSLQFTKQESDQIDIDILDNFADLTDNDRKQIAYFIDANYIWNTKAEEYGFRMAWLTWKHLYNFSEDTLPTESFKSFFTKIRTL